MSTHTRDPRATPPGHEAFCRELTELCRRHRCGIEGGTVFLMEDQPKLDCGGEPHDPDMKATYFLDVDDRLCRQFETMGPAAWAFLGLLQEES